MLKIPYGALIISKLSKICGLYVLDGFFIMVMHNYIVKTFMIKPNYVI